MGHRIDTFLLNGSDENARVDGSVTPVEFSYAPLKYAEIHRMIVTIEDSGSFTASTYGAVPALSSGVDIEYIRKGVTHLLAPMAITSNVHWACYSYDAREFSLSGGGNKAFNVRWSFDRAGDPLKLDPGDSIVMRVNDDLTGLIGHRFMLQGQHVQRGRDGARLDY